jgi:predicted amidohydrolase
MSLELPLTLWATNLARPAPSPAAWVARVERQLTAAKQRGSELFVFPEYACAEWLSWTAPLDPKEEVPWLAEMASTLYPTLAERARALDIALLAGTVPWRGGSEYVNRAWLYTEQGEFYQDKLSLTPWERDPQGWCFNQGTELRICDLQGVRLAILICLDVEVPELAARLVDADIDLLLVPSMTSSGAGHDRVFSCAKARAIELCCPVAAVGAIGNLGREAEPNVSGCALFIPSEPSHATGTIARIGPFATSEDDGPTLDVKAPIAACRALRKGAAEVWPPRLSKDLRVLR